MNIVSVLVDGTANRWIVVTVVAAASCTLTALPAVAFIHRLLTRRTDRREAAEKAERDAQERARDRTQALTLAASTVPTWNALQAIRNEIPRLRDENPPWDTNVDALARECTIRALDLLVEGQSQRLNEMAPVIAGLKPPTATAVGAAATAQMQAHMQQYCDNYNKGLREIQNVARMLDRATYTEPHRQAGAS